MKFPGNRATLLLAHVYLAEKQKINLTTSETSDKTKPIHTIKLLVKLPNSFPVRNNGKPDTC